MRVAAYYRVSTQEQAADHKCSLPMQRRACEGLCAARGWEIVGVFEDAGVSGRKADRPALVAMLNDAKEGKFDRVVFFKIDRFGRSVKVIYDTWDELEAAGLALVSATEPIDTTTPFGKAMKGFIAVLAELEVDTFRERSMMGKVGGAEQKRYMGGLTTFGLDIDAETGNLVEHEAEGPVVRSVYNWYVGDGLTHSQIALQLNAMGVRTRRHRTGDDVGKWYPKQVSRILTDPIYKGEAFYGKTSNGSAAPKEDWIEIHCPTLIDEELWKAAHDRAKRNRRDAQRPRNRKDQFLLQGILKCAECGGSMGTNYRKGHRGGPPYRYYLCNKQQRGESECRPNKSYLHAEVVEGAVLDHIVEVFSNPDKVMELCDEHIGKLAQRQQDEASMLSGLKRNIEKAWKERERYETMWAQERITDAKFDEHVGRVDKQIAEWQADVDRMEEVVVKKVRAEQLRAGAVACAETVSEIKLKAQDQQNRVVRSLIDRVEIDKDNMLSYSCAVEGVLCREEDVTEMTNTPACIAMDAQADHEIVPGVTP